MTQLSQSFGQNGFHGSGGGVVNCGGGMGGYNYGQHTPSHHWGSEKDNHGLEISTKGTVSLKKTVHVILRGLQFKKNYCPIHFGTL